MRIWEKEVQNEFGARVNFRKNERLLYSRDLAVLPSIATRSLRTLPEAIVQPETVEEVSWLVRLATRYDVPLVPRGAGTSGYGGSVPVKGGIVIEFSRMDRIIDLETAMGIVKVGPGVIWENLDNFLKRHGFTLRIYPTSARGSTVGGWVAEGGSGIGSYEYGGIGANIAGLQVVMPDGSVREVAGEEMDIFTGTEGTAGLITRVDLRVRPLDEDVPVLVQFDTIGAFSECVKLINSKGLPLWHISFMTPELVARRQKVTERKLLPEDKVIGLFVFPKGRKDEVSDELFKSINSVKGQTLAAELADEEWAERFYPMRLKRLGPSLIPVEARVPLNSLTQVVEAANKKVEGLALEGSMAEKADVAVLGFVLGDERTLGYNIDWGKSLAILKIAEQHGGRPYSVGMFFTDKAGSVIGDRKVKELTSFKAAKDPKRILNPGKVIPSDGDLSRLIRLAGAGLPLLGIADHIVPRTAGETTKVPSEVAYESLACAYCGYCRNVCTLYSGRRWESASPRGKFNLLKLYMKGRAALDQDDVNTFLLCTTCKRCDEVCQVKTPIQARWDELRGVFVNEKGFQTFPAFEMMGASFELQGNIWANFRKNRADWFPDGLSYQHEGEIGYWAGCTASYVETDIARNAVTILSEGGVKFAYLGTDEQCCGVPFFVSGKWDVFEKAVRHNVAEVKRRGIKKLIVSCPGCWVALQHYYREWAPKFGLDWDVKIEHITETTAQLIKEGMLQFKQPLNLKVTWHDPCHIGRHGGIYEPPREVIRSLPGVEFVEMEHNRENGLCCGSVLTRVGEPVPTSNIIASYRLSEAESAGADLLLTTCPCCEVQLRVGGLACGSRVKVLDFTDLVIQALGFEAEDPTDYVLAMWGIFGRAIELMTPEATVEMMKALMPGMFELMPAMMQSGMNFMSKVPRVAQNGMLALMNGLMPKMMPSLMKQMMPKMLPAVLKYMEEQIPNMPDTMKQLLPEMMPKIMDKLMPAMLPKIMPEVQPYMMELIRQHVSGGKSRAVGA